MKRFERENQELCFGHVILQMLVRYPRRQLCAELKQMGEDWARNKDLRVSSIPLKECRESQKI